MHTAVVFGASGLVGGHCLDALLASADYARVVVVVRRTLARSHPKLVERIVDFDRLADAALADPRDLGEHVFLCLGTTIDAAGSQAQFRKVDHDYAVEAARVARASGGTRCALVSSVGADLAARTFYLRVKAETERDVAEIAPPWECLEIVRPSLLLGDRREVRAGERIGAALSRPLGPLMRGPLEAYRPVAARDVARAMIAALLAAEPGTHTRTRRDILRLARSLDRAEPSARET
jgi:uncharacterized protein YbjT (DUF2867 family)